MGLDPASLPWGVQAWLRGFDLRSAGDSLGPQVTWLGGCYAQLLGREAWASAQGWGGALGLGPHLRRFYLASWAPGLRPPFFENQRYGDEAIYGLPPLRRRGDSASAPAGPAGPWVYSTRGQIRRTWLDPRLPPVVPLAPPVYLNPEIRPRPNPWEVGPARAYLRSLYPQKPLPLYPHPLIFAPYSIPKDMFARSRGRLRPPIASGFVGDWVGVRILIRDLPHYQMPIYPRRGLHSQRLAPQGMTPQRIPL